MEGFESVESMEDNLEDIEEEEDDDEGEEMSPEDVGIQRRLPKPVYPKRYIQPPSFLKEPDVLGYLNTFRELDDPERLRLSRACVNYLTARERQRNGHWLRREQLKQERVSGGSASSKKPLKRTRSMRAIDLTAETAASNNGEYPQ